VDVLGLPARRLGKGLVLFGVVGLTLALVMMVAWLGGLVAMRDLDERLEADRQATAISLVQTAALMASSATTLEDASASLDNVQEALGDAARLLDRLATSTGELAEALNVTILGQQPFAGTSRSFEDVSGDLDILATRSETLAAEVETFHPDLEVVAADLRTVETAIRSLAYRVNSFAGVEDLVGLMRGYALLSALLAAWLASLAAGCVWAGRQLQRVVPGLSAETTPTS
jgi:methyl-accepting chemotaxis protein